MRADERVAGERLRRQRQRIGDVVVDGEALPRERDRRRDQIGEGEFARAVFAPGEFEAGDGAGHADRQAGIARLERIGLAVGVEEHVLGRRRGRGLAVVDGDRLVEIGAMDQHEAAAAEVAGARQGDGEREADRDRRVDRVAAALQDVEPDARRRRLLGDDHAMPGHDRTRGGEGRDERRLIGEGGERGRGREERGRRTETVSNEVLETWLGDHRKSGRPASIPSAPAERYPIAMTRRGRGAGASFRMSAAEIATQPAVGVKPARARWKKIALPRPLARREKFWSSTKVRS